MLPVASVPWPVLFRRRVARRLESAGNYHRWVLGVSLAGMFSVAFTITILAVAIPDIAAEFGSPESMVSWVITGPILTFALVGPSVGRLGDMLGHRRVYLVSLSLAGLFAVFIALSWNTPSLIAFRILGAAGGAATGPSAMAMINRVYPPERRVQAMGYWSLVMAGAPVLGVVVGGPIVDAYSWRWIFVFQVPITILAVLLGVLVLPETRRTRSEGFDLPGGLVLGGSIGALLLAITNGSTWGWGSPAFMGLVALFPVGLALFVGIERRAPSPLIPLAYFRRRNVAMPIVAQMFANFAYMGGFILTPLLLRDPGLFAFDATHAGLLTIARPLTFAVAGPVMGWLALRVGERTNATLGSALVVVSMVVLALGATRQSSLLIVAGLALSGFGLGTAAPSMSATVANAVDETDFGIAGATQQMAAQIGVVLGIQVMQTFRAIRLDQLGVAGLATSYRDAYLLGGVVCLGAIWASVLIRSTPAEARRAVRAQRDGAPAPTPEPAPAVELARTRS